MAASFTCDGCGTAVAQPKQLGHALKRDYCDACFERAESFQEAEDALRKAVVERFNIDRALLISTFAGFKLPDVPDA
jgi:hypothetical protein